MKRLFLKRMGWALILLSAGGVATVGVGEPSTVGTASSSAYGWGPYTSEGTVLSERTMERYGWKAGPFYIQPYAQATAVYDDNVFLNGQDAQKDSEVYTTFTPGATLVLGSPRLSYFYVDYGLDVTTLDTGEGSLVDGQSLTVGLRKHGPKSQFDLAHQYRDVRDVDIEVGTRLKRKTNTTTASIENRVSSKTSVGVLGSHTLNQFESGSYTDYREYKGGGRVSWQMRPKTSLFGQASHGWVDIDERRDAFGSAQYDEVTVGINGHPRPRLAAAGQVGVEHRYFENSAIDDITSEVGSVRLSGSPFDVLQAWLGVSAGLHPAINAPGYTIMDTRIEPGISRRLFVDRVVGALSGVWGRSDYMGTADEEADPDVRVYDGRQDRYWGFNATVDWWIGKYWSVGAGYSHMNSDSDADNRFVDDRRTDPSSYEVNRWMLRASFNR